METRRTKPQESTEMLEMPSLASSDRESSNTIESPSGISIEASDHIAVLSSRTLSSVSPGLFTTEASNASRRVSGSDCCEINVRFPNCCKHTMKINLFNCAIFFIAGAVILVDCFLLRKNDFFHEILYASVLVMYCSVFSCIFKRGYYSKSFWPTYPERNKGDSSSVKALEQRNSQDAVSSSQTNVHEQTTSV
ncbi:unnamed protein product [Larinioides sclopetarius]|uniref:Uncharacterized protein n=1 Tax=Larinioides sclopetarius TaxID=280406 RepID=A0AAV1YXA7_9ARAC